MTKKTTAPKKPATTKKSKYVGKSLLQLVTSYNDMCGSPAGQELGHPRNRPVAKFKDETEGVRRCDQLESSIKAHQEGLKKEKKEKGEKAAAAPKAKAAAAPKGVDNIKGRRRKLFDCLSKKLGKQVDRSKIMVAVYGADDPALYAALTMVTGGLKKVQLDQWGLPYTLKHEGTTYGLYAK